MIPLPWRWLGALAAIAVALGSVYGLGRHHASTAWEQRWTARETALRDAAREAQRVADDVLARQTQATREAAQRFADAQNDNARLAGVNRDLLRRVREHAARPDPVSTAPADPGGACPAAGAGAFPTDGVSEIAAFAVRCAESRDRLADQVAGLIDAWPRHAAAEAIAADLSPGWP